MAEATVGPAPRPERRRRAVHDGNRDSIRYIPAEHGNAAIAVTARSRLYAHVQGMTSFVPPALAAAFTDRYRIERELGGGGMSRVFLAEEIALGRDVVIKVLAPELAEGISAERFAREVKLAARLQQANIVPLLSAGIADGVPWYTMPFVRGESLRASLAQAHLATVPEAVGILRDVARALAYAHAEGVVHRDIKPENILLSGGAAVVTDFGIAKAIRDSRTIDGTGHATLTHVGGSIGTPAYMAPEQAAGDPDTDHRADLYAWGVVAWELLAGTHPFRGTSPQAMLAAHMASAPAPLATARVDVPPALAELVARCLEKDPGTRPQSARELLATLDSLATPVAAAPSVAASGAGAIVAGSVPRARWSRPALAIGSLVVLIGIAMLFWGRDRSTIGSNVPPTNAVQSESALTSLAVLPFVNTGGDTKDEYFSDGMTDELAHALSKLPGLRLAGRSSSFAFKGRTVPAPEVGKTLGVGAIIEGTVRRSGDRLRITAQLTSTRDGRVIWSDGFERAGADVFAVQDAFTSAIVSALTPMLGTAPATSGTDGADARGTRDMVAYDLYLRGRYYWAQRGAGPLDTAAMLFEQVVRRDPRFARGWAGLALTYVMRPNFNVLVPAHPAFDKADAAARNALAIDSTVADAHTAIGMSRLRRLDMRAAGEAFAIARRLEPQNATAHHWSALYFGVAGDTSQSDREIETAMSLDPLSATTLNSRAATLADRRRFAEALEAFGRVSALNVNFGGIFTNSNRALIWTGKADSALRLQRQRLRGAAQRRGRLGALLLAAAAAGQWAEAREVRAMIVRGGDPSIMIFDRAVAELVFGERARAAELFVQSLETEGTIANVMFSTCDPILDPVRGEAAFVAFRARHGLSECPYRSPWPIGTPPRN